METDNRPHILAMWNEWDGDFAWVCPSYEAALQTFRVWFAIMLVEFSEKYADSAETFLAGIPNPSEMSYEDIRNWLFDEDISWDICLLPIANPNDPLQNFYKNRLRDFPESEQERIKQNAARAAKWALGGSTFI